MVDTHAASVGALAKKVAKFSPKGFDLLCQVDEVLALAFPGNPATLALSAACAARSVIQKRRRGK